MEEGSEEVAQSFIKNTVESFYDSWISPSTAEEGSGLFGTRVFNRDEVVGAFEEGLIGSILGGLGGFVNNRSKENSSIIPFIANGDIDVVKAGAALALQKGALYGNITFIFSACAQFYHLMGKRKLHRTVLDGV